MCSSPAATSELQRTSGYRSILIVPMLRDEAAVGAIAVMRLEPQLFPRAQVELLKTFAGQAVIAIENTRLFTEVQERTRQLSQSLEELRAAQDGLVQTEKLAALGRLVAGVAHELNTPVGTSLTVASAFIDRTKRFEANVASGDVRRSALTEFIASSREAASQIMLNLGNAVDLIQSSSRSRPIATFRIADILISARSPNRRSGDCGSACEAKTLRSSSNASLISP